MKQKKYREDRYEELLQTNLTKLKEKKNVVSRHLIEDEDYGEFVKSFDSTLTAITCGKCGYA